MQTYILLTKLAPEVSMKMKKRAEIGHNWLDHVKEKCPQVKFIAHYAILGQYDFIDIYEAPDIETAAKVSIISQANGALTAESMSAIPYKRFVELTKEI
ncbi:MAG: GYD domain-containing protein [Bacteroidales bacterium]|nr:GYD domain-containing protein [Bacteroidales bacterium]